MGITNQDTTRKDASNQLKPSRKGDGVVLLGWPFIFGGIRSLGGTAWKSPTTNRRRTGKATLDVGPPGGRRASSSNRQKGTGRQDNRPDGGPHQAGLERPPNRHGSLVRLGQSQVGHGVRGNPSPDTSTLCPRLRVVQQSERGHRPLLHPRARPSQHQGVHREKRQQ